jgi:2-oxoglutarate dehydrogenase E2 component (dihydrolipoamide succinyltransferase)
MAFVEMLMPKMGESVMEGTILNWLKKVGDKIEQDEAVLEVATDKVDTEIPSLHAGILVEMKAQKGEVVQVGKPIAVIDTGGAAGATTTKPIESPQKQQPENTAANIATTEVKANEEITNRFYSPLVMNMAKQEQVSMAELEKIAGTGQGGRLTKQDMLAYLEAKKSGKLQVATTQTTQNSAISTQTVPIQVQTETKQVEQVKPAVSYSGNVEIIEMDRMRKMIAQRMVESKHTSPHVTSFVEADVTNIVNWRNAHVKAFKEKEGVSLTYTPIFMMAVVKALKDFPLVNSSIDGDKIIIKKDINLGLAVALPSGNLIVPVIKNADQLNLLGMARKVNELAKRARENKLTADELSGGTYTVSNIGSFGNLMGTPIILQPQVAILSLGAIIKKPAVIETPQGDLIGIRQMMFLSHSYDHRIVDGALGGSFVRRVADYLEKFDVSQKVL